MCSKTASNLIFYLDRSVEWIITMFVVIKHSKNVVLIVINTLVELDNASQWINATSHFNNKHLSLTCLLILDGMIFFTRVRNITGILTDYWLDVNDLCIIMRSYCADYVQI